MEGNEQQVVLMKKYRLLEKIGSGSFGSIYRCITPSIQARIFKITSISLPKSYLHPHAGEEGQGRRTAAVRDKALSALPRHPYAWPNPAGIVKLYDFGNDPTHDRIFMVIDLLGKSL
jgi:serine/threonine protein kinase